MSMTREEAIRVFEAWIEHDEKMKYADRLENIEIYKMAIEALKTETKKCPNCGAKMVSLNSEIEKSKSEIVGASGKIVPDLRDGWRWKEGDEE